MVLYIFIQIRYNSEAGIDEVKQILLKFLIDVFMASPSDGALEVAHRVVV